MDCRKGTRNDEVTKKTSALNSLANTVKEHNDAQRTRHPNPELRGSTVCNSVSQCVN